MKNRISHEKSYSKSLLKKIVVIFLTILVSFSTGYIFGLNFSEKEITYSFANLKESLQQKKEVLIVEDVADRKSDREFLIDEIDEKNIENHLKYLTSVAHSAGTYGDLLTANYVAKQWREQGLDSVHLNAYDVLLDFNDDVKFNNVQLKNANGNLDQTYDIKEPIYDNDLNYVNVTKPFLAYSQSGSFQSKSIHYVNYCQQEDFGLLLKNNITIRDSIVMCRFGFIFRGNKIRNAQMFGAKAVLLFDDPLNGTNIADKIYPNDVFIPKDGTQRGTVFLKEGDPLTPIFPSIESAYRINETDQSGLPKIMAQCIGYGLAAELFNLVEIDPKNKHQMPSNWSGFMSNATYSFGGFLKDNKSLTLNIFNSRRISKIFNVVGAIKGYTEPDRYVIIGSHRDSWTVGSIDPSSAQSVLLEVSRSLMELKKRNKWQPKRTILFLSFSGEEYGLVGSTEWVEEFDKKLSSNGVIYINLDMAAYGNYSYEAKASPLIHDLIFDITRSINMPETNNETVYERWTKNDADIDEPSRPFINSNMGANSDHSPFLQRAGIPCIDQKFVHDHKNPKFRRGTFPLYHTSYETFSLYSKLVDPGFKVSKIMTTIIANLAFNISNSAILPFNTFKYAHELMKEYKKFKTNYKAKLDLLEIDLSNLEWAIGNFTVQADKFNQRKRLINESDHLLVRRFNDQLLNLERAFIDHSHLNTNANLHTIFASSSINKYSGYSFPSLVDAIIQYEKTFKRTHMATNLIEDIKLKLSIIIYRIQSATSILKDPIDFERYI